MYYIRGECSDWNWNGSYIYYDFLDYSDGSHEKRTVSGAMRDCLCDGIVIEEILMNGDQITEEILYEYGKIQPHYDSHGVLQPGSNDYHTGVFRTGGWTEIETVKNDLWWN